MNESRSNLRSWLIAIVCLLVAAGSGLSIYFTQFAAPDFKVPLHRAVGQTLAEETSRLLGHHGKIVLISIESAKAPELNVQLEQFEETLKRAGSVKIEKTYHLETEGKAKYGTGSGLSGRRYVRIVNKNTDADAFVSFVGVPDLADTELNELKKKPKLVAETRSVEKLAKAFQQQIVQVAIASRFNFPAPVEGKPRSSRQWFDKYFEIVTLDNFKALLSLNAPEK
jgi:hypothetical protein